MKVSEIAVALLVQITQIKWIFFGILVVIVIGLVGIIFTILLARKTGKQEKN